MNEMFWVTMVPLIAAIIVTLGIIVAWRAVKERRSGFPLKDERTTRLQGKAATLTFYIGVWYLLLLNYYNIYRIEFLDLEELGSMAVINSAVILMGLSYIALYAYFNKKEDVAG